MINKFFTKIKQAKAGFTLVETLGAVLLLSIALVGPMVIAEKGLQAALISKDQNTAFNLAQDAVEFVRFARDTNCLKAGTSNCPLASWLTGSGVNLAPCINTNTVGSPPSTCYIDSIQNTVTACASGVCPAINYDSTNNYFSYTSGTATTFTRTIQITNYNGSCTGSCNQSEADLLVTVSWSDPVAHSIQVNESLYDWQ